MQKDMSFVPPYKKLFSKYDLQVSSFFSHFSVLVKLSKINGRSRVFLLKLCAYTPCPSFPRNSFFSPALYRVVDKSRDDYRVVIKKFQTMVNQEKVFKF